MWTLSTHLHGCLVPSGLAVNDFPQTPSSPWAPVLDVQSQTMITCLAIEELQHPLLIQHDLQAFRRRSSDISGSDYIMKLIIASSRVSRMTPQLARRTRTSASESLANVPTLKPLFRCVLTIFGEGQPICPGGTHDSHRLALRSTDHSASEAYSALPNLFFNEKMVLRADSESLLHAIPNFAGGTLALWP